MLVCIAFPKIAASMRSRRSVRPACSIAARAAWTARSMPVKSLNAPPTEPKGVLVAERNTTRPASPPRFFPGADAWSVVVLKMSLILGDAIHFLPDGVQHPDQIGLFFPGILLHRLPVQIVGDSRDLRKNLPGLVTEKDIDDAAVAGCATAFDEAVPFHPADYAGDRGVVEVQVAAQLRLRETVLLRQEREDDVLGRRQAVCHEPGFQTALHGTRGAVQEEAHAHVESVHSDSVNVWRNDPGEIYRARESGSRRTEQRRLIAHQCLEISSHSIS